ncbi:MAG: competence type IV pilus major pilin ComGC [Planctomycetota bacterium]|jgi:prepilin-type N-terminal cleavage/methylation domain-containing protein
MHLRTSRGVKCSMSARDSASCRVRPARRAFTFIELLIVVGLLGILAAIVVPRFVDASGEATESAIKQELKTVRTQIELYRFKHGQFPLAVPALVVDGYLREMPVHPPGGDYVYVPSTGVFSSSMDPTW